MPAAEVLSLKQLGEWAARSSAALSRNYSNPLKTCRGLIIESVRDNFQGSHDPDGSPWKPLGHERPAGGDKPLSNTGLLKGSVTGGGSGHVEELSETSLVMGTNLDRAAIHQWGGVIRPRNAKMLAIPLTKEAARHTSPRNFPRPLGLVTRPGHPAFLVEQTLGRRKRKGKGLIGPLLPGEERPGVEVVGPQELGRGAKTIWQYLLLSSVRIPARQFLGFGSKLIDQIGKVFGDWMGGQL